MFIKTMAVLFTCLSLLVYACDLEARGGGGGGRGGGGGGGARGGGGGGGARGGSSAGRSPSISSGGNRASANRGGGNAANINRGGNNPGGGNRAGGSRVDGSRVDGSRVDGSRAGGNRDGVNRADVRRADGSRVDVRASGGDRNINVLRGERPSRNDVSDFLGLPEQGGNADRAQLRDGAQDRRADRAPARDTSPQDRQTDRQDRRGSRDAPQRVSPEKRQERQAGRKTRANDIRIDFNRHHPSWDFWQSHPDWARWRWTRPYAWANWAGLLTWFGWGSGYDNVLYDYGDNLYYDDGNVYEDGQQVATEQEYAEQAEQLAAEGGKKVGDMPDDTKWMSLGVFALTHEEKGDPVVFFQLAVDKDGVIAGTYHNTISGVTKNVEGMVDKKTQRAAWYVEDKPETVIETGIYNLTQNETQVLIHFGTSDTQTWLLVRMDEPSEAEKGAS